MAKQGRLKLAVAWLVLAALLMAGAIAAVLFGSAMGPLESIRTVLGGDATALLIVLQIRLPRIALALLVGGALSVSGGAMQGMFRNPLADPHILGVAAGASFGAMLAMVFSMDSASFGMGAVTLFAFLGGLGSMFAVYALGRAGRAMTSSGLLLAGIAVGTVLSAATTLLMSLNHDKVERIIYWNMGSLSVAGWSSVLWSLPMVIIGCVGLLLFGRQLNLLALGEEEAQHLGVNVDALRRALMAFAAIATAGAVSAAGIIGFVGLIVPHVLRMLIGPDHRRLLPLSLLGGGVFLLLADTAARNIIPGMELPVGVLTSLIGGPFFLWLLIRKGVR